MKKNILQIGGQLLILAVIFFYPQKAQAQLLMNQTYSSTMGAAAHLGEVARAPAAFKLIKKRLKTQGYTKIKKTSAKPKELMAISPAGIPVKVKIEPRTGQIISIMPR